MSKRAAALVTDDSDSGDESSSNGSSRAGKVQKKQKGKRVFLESNWNITEKEKLLEALRKYSPSNSESISQYIGTKSSGEVLARINAIRHSYTVTKNRRLNDTLNQNKAPLEAWWPLGMELVTQENPDLSFSLPKVIEILGHYDTPKESFHPKLNWQNIYRYLRDLIDDCSSLPTLTDLEAYVVLDLIHDLGSSFSNLETLEQRNILCSKYKLLRTHPERHPGLTKNDLVVMAMKNDFSVLETETDATPSAAVAPPSSSTSSSSSTSLIHISDASTPPQTQAPERLSFLSKSPPSSSSSSLPQSRENMFTVIARWPSSSSATSSTAKTAMSRTSSATCAPPTQISTIVAATATTNRPTSIADDSATTTSANNTSIVDDPATTTSANNTTVIDESAAFTSANNTSFIDDSATSVAETNSSRTEVGNKAKKTDSSQNNDNTGQKEKEAATAFTPENTAWTPESGYARPRYFTMNPFCIPPQLINFTPKKS